MATITGDEYTVVLKERQDLQQKLEAALSDSEFLTVHYKRLLRACEKSYEQVTSSNIVLERKERNKTVREKQAALKARKQAERA